MTETSDTIHALASASGKAGVAVVRLSGQTATDILSALTQKPIPTPRMLALRSLYTPSESAPLFIDEALVAYMPGPNSFTGEDCVELHIHGGPAILKALLHALDVIGLSRMAEPGEFTRRAFENGRVDLTQAESIADLIDAETEAQRQQAVRIYDGEVQQRISAWRDRLVDAMSSLEAAIDFPDEDDVPAGVDSRAYPMVIDLQQDLSHALEDGRRGMAVRDGFRIAILGEPNAGKSSLLNALAGRDAAIVSDIAGTTRDVIDVRMDLSGYVVWLSDTAGLRETDDVVEAEGVKRALARAEDADLRILVVPVTQPDWSLDLLRPGDVVVQNKIDLSSVQSDLENEAAASHLDHLSISVATGAGLDALEAHMSDIVVSRLTHMASPIVTRERHRGFIAKALDHLGHARSVLEQELGAELAGEDLRLAARALGEIIGDVDVEHLLDRIFCEFCIGK